jgi:hypothetical protein
LHADTKPAKVCGWPIFEGGRTFYHYTYVELEPVTSAPITNTQSLTLNWGDHLSKDVPQSPGSWHMKVILWNGVELDAPPKVNNPWVSLADLSNKVGYSAIDLSTVDLSQITPTS